MKSQTLKRACGAILALLVVGSAGLAVAGIWGAIDVDSAGQLFLTFVTVGAASSSVTYIADQFFA